MHIYSYEKQYHSPQVLEHANQHTGTPWLMQQLCSVRYSTSPILHNSEFSTHMVKYVCIQKGVQLKFKLQNTGTWSATAWLPHCLCYHPAVHFCHMSLHFHYPKKNPFFTFLKIAYIWNCIHQEMSVRQRVEHKQRESICHNACKMHIL